MPPKRKAKQTSTKSSNNPKSVPSNDEQSILPPQTMDVHSENIAILPAPMKAEEPLFEENETEVSLELNGT